MTKGKGRDNRPEFSIADVRSTDPVKEGEGWRSTAMTTVKHRSNRPPRQPVEINFLVNSRVVGEPMSTDEHGRARIDIIFHKPGRHYLEVQIVGTSLTRGIYVSVEEKKRETKLAYSIETSEVELAPGKWLVNFFALDKDLHPVQGLVIEVFDAEFLVEGKKLVPTDANGRTTYECEFVGREAEHEFDYVSGNIHHTKRLWR